MYSEKTGKLKCLKLDCQDYASLSPLFSFINSNLKLKHLIIPAIPANPATERTTEIHDRNELKYWKELCDFIAKDYALEILTLSSSNSKYSDHLVTSVSMINIHLVGIHTIGYSTAEKYASQKTASRVFTLSGTNNCSTPISPKQQASKIYTHQRRKRRFRVSNSLQRFPSSQIDIKPISQESVLG